MTMSDFWLSNEVLQLNLSSETNDKAVDIMIQMANICLISFTESLSISGLNMAIERNRAALRVWTSPNLQRASFLGSLASAIHSRFHRTYQADDLDEVISLYRELLNNQSHSDRIAWDHSLCAALITRFTQTGQLLDLRNALSLYSRLLLQGSQGLTHDSVSDNE
jgi:hypothetical protein